QGEQARQAVVADRHSGRLMRAAQGVPGQLGVDAQTLARVSMMTHEVSDASALIEQRRDRHLVPKYAPVLAIVAQQHTAGFPLRKRLAQSMPAVLLAIVRLQEAQVAADQFRR